MTDPVDSSAPDGARDGDVPRGPSGFGLLELTQTRPVGVFMVTIAVVAFGLISLGKLPVNLMPDFSYPTLTVRTEYPGTAPGDVEERVSRRIEESLAVTKGLREIHSVSRAGVSDVTLEFDWDTDMKFAAQDVRELLDQVFLPDDAEAPILLRYDPNQDPILRLAIWGSADLKSLRRLVEEEIRRELETVPGVAAVQVRGGLEDQVLIEIDEGALTARSLDIGFIGQRLTDENLNLASGELLEGETEYIVRTLTEFRNLAEIENLILEMREGAAVRLRDVARVTRSFAEREVVTRIDGEECVLLDIYKEAESNLVQVARSVRERVFGTEKQQAWVAKNPQASAPDSIAEGEPTEESRKERRKRIQREAKDRRMRDYLRQQLPADLEVRALADQSRFIEASIREVRSAAILGGILAVIVLFLFLRRVRPTLIIATSIPVSIAATFAPMFLFDVSLNVMSLGGLALGVGMLVDNSIVVLESITRRLESTNSIGSAALRGTRDVAAAITASTLTTVSVFFPMVFVEGIAGQIFRDQALTVVFSLVVSLFVALFFITMLASRRLDTSHFLTPSPARWMGRFRSFTMLATNVREHTRRVPLWLLLPLDLLLFVVHLILEIIGRVFMGLFAIAMLALGLLWRVIVTVLGPIARIVGSTFQRTFETLQSMYRRSLTGALHRPLEVTIVIALLTAGSLSLLPRIGSELIPTLHQSEFTIEVTLPAGTPLLENARLTAELERRLAEVPEIEDVFSVIGVEEDVVTEGEEGPHTTRLVVRLTPTNDPAATEERVKEALHGSLALPEIRAMRFRNPALFSFKTPIEVEIKNDDLDALRLDADRVERLLSTIPELRDVQSSVQRGSPEIRIRFDREKLARYGLNQGAVQEILRSKIYGDVPTRFAADDVDEKIEILVRVDEDELRTLDDVRAIIINPGEPTPRPLRDVATFEEREGPSEIRHLGLTRGAVVTANLVGLDLATATERIEEALDEARQASEGSTFEIGGQKREMDVSIRSLQNALLLAVFLVYLVMAALFESFLQPLIILLAIPLAMLGVIPTLVLLDIPLSIVVFIGMIMLAGIVVNNAIVLIDAINRFRREGYDRLESIRRGGEIRFRPILMTTMTTVLGLLPLTGALGLIPGITNLVSAGAGAGTEIRAPLAITVISGLLASTFLTLFVVPIGYSLLTRDRAPNPEAAS